ncbi:MAG TPA: YhcH/YjgK/YiaL family protein [Candidatus Methylacidiphilales bacterium]
MTSLPLLRGTPFPPGTLCARAVECLLGLSPEAAPGRHEGEGKNLFVTVHDYETGPAGAKPYEAHARYADIHYVLRGRETIHYAPLDRLRPLSPYDGEKDIRFYEGRDEDLPSLVLEAGAFALFLPGEAHKPGCLAGTSPYVKKAVAKILLPAPALAVRGDG